MPHDFLHEAIAKFLIPDQPQEDNYLDHNEFKEKEKEWEEKWDLVLVQHTAWVEREQVAEAKCAAEAAHAAMEKQKLRCEAAECKQKMAAVGGIIVQYPPHLCSPFSTLTAIPIFPFYILYPPSTKNAREQPLNSTSTHIHFHIPIPKSIRNPDSFMPS